MRIYVASSWRNEHQQAIVKRFRDEGHEVYDFKNPAPGQHGFSWKETSPVPPEQWSAADFAAALVTDPAERGFGLDMDALKWCDVCVCVLPCGKDAHLEAGWAAGAGKKTAILLLDKADGSRGWEAGLMYKMCSLFTNSIDAVSNWLRALDGPVRATEVKASAAGRGGAHGECG